MSPTIIPPPVRLLPGQARSLTKSPRAPADEPARQNSGLPIPLPCRYCGDFPFIRVSAGGIVEVFCVPCAIGSLDMDGVQGAIDRWNRSWGRGDAHG